MSSHGNLKITVLQAALKFIDDDDDDDFGDDYIYTI